MNVINVNGKRIELPDGARNVRITGDGTVTVGGVLVASGLTGVVEVKWEGPLANLSSAASVTVYGDVSGRVNAGGSVTCGTINGGGCDAGGSVTCGDVTGDVDSGGSVRCGKVSGRVSAGGSVRHG